MANTESMPPPSPGALVELRRDVEPWIRGDIAHVIALSRGHVVLERVSWGVHDGGERRIVPADAVVPVRSLHGVHV